MNKSKSFTLIELLVTVGIIILLAAAAGPALKIHQDQVNLDVAVRAVKDGILETQGLAFSPDRGDAGHYLLVLNISNSDQTYASQTILPRSYALFEIPGPDGSGGIVSSDRNWIDTFQVSTAPVSLSSNYPLVGGAPPTDLFKIHFRTSDGAPGFEGIYYNYPNPATWNDLWNGSDYADLTITFANKSKTIKIHKISGQIEVE